MDIVAGQVIPYGRHGALISVPDTKAIILLLHGEHPDRAAFWHIRILARQQPVQACLHRTRIDPPARLDGDVLPAVDHERRRLARDA